MAEPRWHRPRLLFRTILCAVLFVNCVQCRDSGETVPNATKDSSSDYFSVRDSFFNGSDISKCLNLNLVTCLKVSLLGKVTRLLELTKERQLERSTDLMGGLVTLETTSEDSDVVEDSGDGVDEEWDADEALDAAKEERLNELLFDRLTAFFRDKRLTLKFIPGLTLRVFPAKTIKEFVRLSVQFSGENLQQVMARTMKMGGMMRSPWMLIGPMITLGMFPFMLANLKYMVMNAFMINNMALMMALRTTITNLVFGDGEGDNIVYRNKGYSNEYKDKPIEDHHGPIRYSVKPYNQINKYRKVYEPRPSSSHSQSGGDHFASGSQNSYSVTTPKNSTRDEGFQPPVKYIAHHDYFGKRRPAVSLISRPRVPAGTKPVKYVEHHDYFGSASRRPSVGERVKEPNNPVKYVGNSDFSGGMRPVDAQRNNILARPVVVPQFSPAFHEDSNGKFEPSNDYLPGNFEHVKKENPVTTFSHQNSQFTPTFQENPFVINANGQDYLNTVNNHNHQNQGQSNHQNSNEIPPNHKIYDEIGDYNYFGMQSRVDSPTQKKDDNNVDAKPVVKTPPGAAEIAVNHPVKSAKKTDAPFVNTVVDRDQNSWVAKGDNDHWPIIYQDPTTFHQEAKIKTTEVGTVFPVFTGTGVAKPETESGPKHSVQVSSGIRFENAAPKIESNVELPGVGLGSGGFFGNGEVISVSPHEDSDPALTFRDSLDLSDENEFVNFPQRLIQIQPGQKIDRRIGTESLEPETTQSDTRGSQRIAGSSRQDRNPTSFPEPLWVFRE